MSRHKSPAEDNGTSLVDRRIRHITAIQIHNLTLFPARDSFASALSQPAEQPQFTSHGHLSDDLDVTMQQRRTRRISTNSHRSMRSEDGLRNEGSTVAAGGALAERGRKASGPRVNFPLEGADHRQNSSGSAPTIRPHRARTSSTGSYISNPSCLSPSLYGGSTSAVLSPFGVAFPDHSQTELEKVMQSRLVETFITITVPEPPPLPKDMPSPALSLHSPHALKVKATSSNEGSAASKVAKTSPFSPLDNKTPTKSRRESSATSSKFPSRPSLSHTKSVSTPIVRTNGEMRRAASQSATAHVVRNQLQKPATPTPNYFSPIHRPSTHPHFAIDTNSYRDFGEGINYSGSKMKVEVWGKVGLGWNRNVSGKGKEKEIESLDSDQEWKILQERDVDLRDLVPLSDSSAINTSHLPPNSLFFTLSPLGESFYLPPPTSSSRRSHSPASGYASDPESDVRKLNGMDNLTPVTGTMEGPTRDSPITVSRRRHRGGGAKTPLPSQQEVPALTAGWQDLLKLVTLQSCILDNESSLSDIVQGIDKVLDADDRHAQRREASEREAHLEEYRVNHRKVIEDSNALRSRIQVRTENLRQRKQMLKLAQEQLQQSVESQFDLQEDINHDQAQHASLLARFGPTRTTLIGILSSIYPIELLSPPDLLYTILDVPLPIPLSSSDPAPPLSLASHKDVNEDAVATALGYAAQVVQLLSAYLGKSLVYPVTCIGSRSLIRDNISAMVGPRMFPLYSKGVDTYRFEYGVFLLNKDIELLMTDRDLRALDMRHTLPNLKNLLLTLSDGEGARLRHSRPPDSPMSLASELDLASRPESPVETDSSTPKASNVVAIEGTPPASGHTTPTTAAMADASKKGRQFLAFSPLTDFWRGRYPSSSRIPVKSNTDTEEVQPEERSLSSSPISDTSDDEDRKTISGASQGVADRRRVVSAPMNGGDEKLDEDTPSPLTPVVRI